MKTQKRISRRAFARLGAAAAFGVGVVSFDPHASAAQTTPQAGTAGGAQPARPPVPPPDSLKSEFLMDLVLETAPAISFGARTAVAVTGGTFTGPKLKGKVIGPGADWPMTINPSLRVLDVRTILVTDDEQRIYCTYRGVISTDSQGNRYWRTVPIFETDAKKYEWLTQAVFVGVSYTVPQRVAYRIFQIL